MGTLSWRMALLRNWILKAYAYHTAVIYARAHIRYLEGKFLYGFNKNSN
jgi:hypothetical protein